MPTLDQIALVKKATCFFFSFYLFEILLLQINILSVKSTTKIENFELSQNLKG